MEVIKHHFCKAGFPDEVVEYVATDIRYCIPQPASIRESDLNSSIVVMEGTFQYARSLYCK